MVRSTTSLRAAFAAALTLALGALASAPVGAQEAHGWVTYAHNNFPVALATVRLVRSDGSIAATGETGFDGRFDLEAPEPGEYSVHVEHLTAYAMVDGPIALGEEGRALVSFQLVPKPLALGAIEVEVRRRSLPLARTGFYDRERMGLGHFIGPEQIERRAPLRTTDLLRAVPGLRVLEANGLAGFGAYPVTSYSMRTRLNPNAGFCFPRVYRDGVVVEQGGEHAPFSDFDDLILPSELEGMEVYSSPVEAPAQYGGLTACGVILLWTKQGR